METTLHYTTLHSTSVSTSNLFFFPSRAEIPLFHVLNARITFGNVNKCSTEEEAITTPAATPTSSGEDEEAAGRNATNLTTKCDRML